jgi:hypothetical protein
VGPVPDEGSEDPELKAACNAYLSNFDVISENRNIIEHAIVDANNLPGKIALLKRSKSGALTTIWIEPIVFADCCKEAKELFEFGCTIEARFLTRRNGEKPLELPPTSPRPQKLSLRQHDSTAQVP